MEGPDSGAPKGEVEIRDCLYSFCGIGTLPISQYPLAANTMAFPREKRGLSNGNRGPRAFGLWRIHYSLFILLGRSFSPFLALICWSRTFQSKSGLMWQFGRSLKVKASKFRFSVTMEKEENGERKLNVGAGYSAVRRRGDRLLAFSEWKSYLVQFERLTLCIKWLFRAPETLWCKSWL